MVISLGTVSLFAWKGTRSATGSALGVLALAMSVAFVNYSTSGLENPLSHLILVLFFLVYLRGEKTDTAKPLLLSFLAALAALNRMDSILLFLPTLAYLIIRRKDRRTAGALAIGMTPWFFGSPFPNLLRHAVPQYRLREAEQPHPRPRVGMAGLLLSLEFAENRSDHFSHHILRDGDRDPDPKASFPNRPWNRTLPAVRGESGRRLYERSLPDVAADGGYGDFGHPHLDLGKSLASRVHRNHRAGFSSLDAKRPIRGKLRLGSDDSWPYIVAEHGIADERSFYYQVTGLLRAIQQPGEELSLFPSKNQGRAIRMTTDIMQARMVLPLAATGFIGFYVGPNVHVVDELAVCDPLLARLRPHPIHSGASATFIGRFPMAIWKLFVAERTGSAIQAWPSITIT